MNDFISFPRDYQYFTKALIRVRTMIEIFDNIKKIYRFSPPCEELADYIEFFGESCLEDTTHFAAGQNFQVKMFPSWTPTIWINLGAPYRLQLDQQFFPVGHQQDILIVRDSIAVRHNLPTDYIFTVKFFPGGLEAIFGISQVKMSGKPVGLQNILPAQLLHNVKKPGSFEHRIGLLQNFFLAHRNGRKKKDHFLGIVRDSMNEYTTGGMHANTTEIAEKMFISSRTINRYFNDIVGVGPKKYFSTVRTRTALTAYLAEKKTFSPDNFGYHDMSHFYKDVQKFTQNSLAANGS